MTYRTLKICTILLPTVIIGGFEFIRHDWLLDHLSMEAGNVYITILTFILSYIFATWMFKKIERMNERLIAAQSQRAVYEERERLASELHDNIAQTLFFLNVKLKKGKLDETKAAVMELDQTVRQAIFNLRSKPEETGSLGARLEKWLSEWQTLTGIEASVEMKLEEHPFTVQEEVLLFSIVQEAFTNIRKHSNATKAEIECNAGPKGWSLRIEDNGVGMPATAQTGTTYGLKLIQERVQAMGGELTMTSSPVVGTTLLVHGRKGRPVV